MLSKSTRFYSNIKCKLLHIIQPPIDCDSHVRNRQICYKNFYSLVCENRESKLRAQNLHCILYSKYFTTRFIVQQSPESKDETLEDDEEIKKEFKTLIKQDWGSSSDFDEEYLNCIERLKHRDVFEAYRDVNQRIMTNGLTGPEKELFFFGTSITNAYLDRMLQLDINQLMSRRERIKRLLGDWDFLNAWITSIGIVFFGFVFSFKSRGQREVAL